MCGCFLLAAHAAHDPDCGQIPPASAYGFGLAACLCAALAIVIGVCSWERTPRVGLAAIVFGIVFVVAWFWVALAHSGGCLN
jgi:hypothetical protein